MFLPALVEHFWNLELGWEETKVKITHYVFVVVGLCIRRLIGAASMRRYASC